MTSFANSFGRTSQQPRVPLRRVQRTRVAAAGPPVSNSPQDVLAALEALVRDAAASSAAGGSGRWEESESSWVLFPEGPPRGVVHFCGGAFVGACPQLTYRLFLETLVERTGVVVVATPYSLSFDHLRVADAVQFAFDRTCRALGPRLPAELPVWGLGHSMGALAQTLLASRYAVTRAGLILLSFNNKPATDAIPLFAPLVSPVAQSLSPLLNAAATSPLRGGAEALSASLRAQAPAVLREALPLLDQLEPLVLDVAAGRAEFTPAPAETARLLTAYYSVGRTLLLRFREDTIDETPALAATLSNCAATSAGGEPFELTVTALPGDHVRPLQQLLPPPPPALLGAATSSVETLQQLSAFTAAFGAPTWGLDALRAGVQAAADGLSAAAPAASASAAADIGLLVDEIATWMSTRGGGPMTQPEPPAAPPPGPQAGA